MDDAWGSPWADEAVFAPESKQGIEAPERVKSIIAPIDTDPWLNQTSFDEWGSFDDGADGAKAVELEKRTANAFSDFGWGETEPSSPGRRKHNEHEDDDPWGNSHLTVEEATVPKAVEDEVLTLNPEFRSHDLEEPPATEKADLDHSVEQTLEPQLQDAIDFSRIAENPLADAEIETIKIDAAAEKENPTVDAKTKHDISLAKDEELPLTDAYCADGEGENESNETLDSRPCTPEHIEAAGELAETENSPVSTDGRNTPASPRPEDRANRWGSPVSTDKRNVSASPRLRRRLDPDDITARGHRSSKSADGRPILGRRRSSKIQHLVTMYNGLERKASTSTLKPVPDDAATEKDAATEDMSSSGDEDDDFGDFEDESSEIAIEEFKEPQKAAGTQLPPDVHDSSEAMAGQDATRHTKTEAPVFTLDLSILDDLFGPDAIKAPTEPAESDSNIVNVEDFSSMEQRKTWYRISRYGSMRKHDTGNDENYVRIKWPDSQIRTETLKVVSRWMNEDRMVGGTGLGLPGSRPGSLFGWGEASTSGPIDLSAIWGSKQRQNGHKHSASRTGQTAKQGLDSPQTSPDIQKDTAVAKPKSQSSRTSRDDSQFAWSTVASDKTSGVIPAKDTNLNKSEQNPVVVGRTGQAISDASTAPKRPQVDSPSFNWNSTAQTKPDESGRAKPIARADLSILSPPMTPKASEGFTSSDAISSRLHPTAQHPIVQPVGPPAATTAANKFPSRESSVPPPPPTELSTEVSESLGDEEEDDDDDEEWGEMVESAAPTLTVPDIRIPAFPSISKSASTFEDILQPAPTPSSKPASTFEHILQPASNSTIPDIRASAFAPSSKPISNFEQILQPAPKIPAIIKTPESTPPAFQWPKSSVEDPKPLPRPVGSAATRTVSPGMLQRGHRSTMSLGGGATPESLRGRPPLRKHHPSQDFMIFDQRSTLFSTRSDDLLQLPDMFMQPQGAYPSRPGQTERRLSRGSPSPLRHQSSMSLGGGEFQPNRRPVANVRSVQPATSFDDIFGTSWPRSAVSSPASHKSPFRADAAVTNSGSMADLMSLEEPMVASVPMGNGGSKAVNESSAPIIRNHSGERRNEEETIKQIIGRLPNLSYMLRR
jgi:hypothetical protein